MRSSFFQSLPIDKPWYPVMLLNVHTLVEVTKVIVGNPPEMLRITKSVVQSVQRKYIAQI